MEPLYLIFGIVVLLLIIAGIFKFLKLAIKILALVFIVSTIIIGVGVYNDYKEFKNNGSFLLFLENEGYLLAGVLMGEEVEFLSSEKIVESTENFGKGDFEGLAGESFKVLIIERAFLERVVSEELEFDDKVFSKTDIFGAMDSMNPMNELIELEGTNISFLSANDLGDVVEFKGMLFSILLKDFIKNNVSEIPIALRNKEIKVVPSSMAVSLIKYFPMGLIKNWGDKLNVEKLKVLEEGK